MVLSVTKSSQLLVTGYHSVCVHVCVCVCVHVFARVYVCKCVHMYSEWRRGELVSNACPSASFPLSSPYHPPYFPWAVVVFNSFFLYVFFFFSCVLGRVEKTKLLSEFMCHKTHPLK